MTYREISLQDYAVATATAGTANFDMLLRGLVVLHLHFPLPFLFISLITQQYKITYWIGCFFPL